MRAMRAIKRFHVTVINPPCDILGTPESTETFVMTTDLTTLMRIWDPYHDQIDTRTPTRDM
jgi:hypothetical protein